MLTLSEVNAQEFKYRYKANGIIYSKKNVIPSETPTIPNESPVIDAVSAPDSYTGETYSYIVSGSDPDGDTLTWSWSGNTPPGLNINSATGEITGTPNMEGVYNFQITLSDNKNASDNTNETIEILGCNNGPIGAVCEDETIFVGNNAGTRLYLIKQVAVAPTANWVNANNNCINLGGFLPTRQEVLSILSGLSATNNEFRNENNWTSEELSPGSGDYYNYMVSADLFVEAPGSFIFGYHCIKH